MINETAVNLPNNDPSLWGIIFFLFLLLIGIALVSIHYRKKYEEKKTQNKILKKLIYKYEKLFE
jgi:hypothetical protein